jgi:hypothetical protein
VAVEVGTDAFDAFAAVVGTEVEVAVDATDSFTGAVLVGFAVVVFFAALELILYLLSGFF